MSALSTLLTSGLVAASIFDSNAHVKQTTHVEPGDLPPRKVRGVGHNQHAKKRAKKRKQVRRERSKK